MKIVRKSIILILTTKVLRQNMGTKSKVSYSFKKVKCTPDVTVYASLVNMK